MWAGWKWVGLVVSLLMAIPGIAIAIASLGAGHGFGENSQLTITGFFTALALWCLYLIWRGKKRRSISSFGPAASRQQGQAILDNLSSGQPVSAKPAKAILHPGEIALIAVPGALYENQTIYRGRGTNVRVRVLKNVSVGRSIGQTHGVKAMVKVSDGEFVVTGQRVVFAGNAKSFEAPLSKLTNVETYTDGTGLHLNSAVHLITFSSSELSLAANFALTLALEGKFKPQTA